MGHSRRNIAAVSLYFLLAAVTLALAEWLGRRGVPTRQTRKLVHVTAGTSPLIILPLATRRWAGLLPYLVTIPMNLLLWRSRALRSLRAREERPGIVFFPVAQSILIARLWTPGTAPRASPALFSAIMALAWGDALAALVGQAFGKHRYGPAGKTKSLEGSAAMFLTTGLATAFFHWRGAGGARRLVTRSLLAAAAATVAEGMTHRGLDNLAVPLAVLLVLMPRGRAITP